MPSKYQEYRQMADTAERQLTSSYKSWTQFLRTAARLYKYPYNEQIMIHAQRPDATACAEYDFWNKKMGRFVRRGSTGIALIDTSGQKPQLRYVFDVADTGERSTPGPCTSGSSAQSMRMPSLPRWSEITMCPAATELSSRWSQQPPGLQRNTGRITNGTFSTTLTILILMGMMSSTPRCSSEMPQRSVSPTC